MNKKEILITLKQLSTTQGFYARIWATLEDLRRTNNDDYQRALTILEEQHFNDAVDLIMYLED